MALQQYIESRVRQRKLFMPYLTAGDPDFDSTVEFAGLMIEAGADLLEIGIPFSDPTADGPVIQAAMVRAMSRNDFGLDRVFETIKKIHTANPGVPIIILTYMNPVLNGYPGYKNPSGLGSFESRDAVSRLSIENFIEKCRESGVQGLVIPDLPFDQPESEILQEVGKKANIHQILMVAPTTGAARKKEICKKASGFLYYVTSTGVTGERKDFPPDMQRNITEVKELSGLPIFAGFGFNHPDQVLPVKDSVDGIIVGSHNHRIIAELGKQSGSKLKEESEAFIRALK